MKKAIVLCSGGIDSVTASHYVKKKLNYSKIIILFFNYGQKSLNKERGCSQFCAKELDANFKEIELNWLGEISTSLINCEGKVNEVKDLRDTKKESEKFYVPCRNTIFLTYALALAESLFIKNKEKFDIFVGFKCEGKESYPDTTKEFVKEINSLSRLSCNGKFKIIAPLINKDKEDIVKLGEKLGVYFKDTHSCYISDKHCGTCLACMLRKAGFYWANVKDVTDYETSN